MRLPGFADVNDTDEITDDEPVERVVIPYQPRPFQRQLHADESRFKVLVCHRRFGKTIYAINEGIKAVMTCPHEAPRAMYCSPYLNQSKKVAWDYLVKYSLPIPGIKINKGELSITYPNGGKFTLAGADTAHAHRGIYLDFLILDEYAQMSGYIFSEIFRPALSDRLGRAVFIGTPKGRANNFYDVYDRAGRLPGWSRYLITVDDTGLISPEELESARLEMTPDEYNQEFLCSFDAAIRGAYWGQAMQKAQDEKRIGKVPWYEELPVYTACDLGMRDSFSIWFFQFVGKEVHFINYKEFSGMGLPAVVSELRKLPYQYAEHVAPHDIRVRELGTGQSRYEIALGLGIQYRIARKIDVQDGIDSVRNWLSRAWFDEEACRYGIDALRSYHSEYDDKKRIESSAPVHDWSSHAADAIRYAAVQYASGQSSLFGELDYTKLQRRAI